MKPLREKLFKILKTGSEILLKKYLDKYKIDESTWNNAMISVAVRGDVKLLKYMVSKRGYISFGQIYTVDTILSAIHSSSDFKPMREYLTDMRLKGIIRYPKRS